eukprot:jgi/Chlat1/7891/Chrsp66S07308
MRVPRRVNESFQQIQLRIMPGLSEVMRAVGYPRAVSVEAFRQPNFALLAHALRWLTLRYDPIAVNIPEDVGTEQARVMFLKAVGDFMANKAKLKLNLKRLYGADGYAAKELLKVASLLYSPAAADQEEDLEWVEEEAGGAGAAAARVGDAAAVARALAGEVAQRAAGLFDALAQEPELREARARALARDTDMDSIERAVREAINAVQESAASLEAVLESLTADERALEARIEKRKQELDRAEKRLATLQHVKPAHMEEAERLGGELSALYAGYAERARNLAWLEGRLACREDQERAHADEHARRMKRMRQKLKEEEMRILRGELAIDEARIDDSEGGRSAGSGSTEGNDGNGNLHYNVDDIELSSSDNDAPGRSHPRGGGRRLSNDNNVAMRGRRENGPQDGGVRTTTRGGRVMGSLEGPGGDDDSSEISGLSDVDGDTESGEILINNSRDDSRDLMDDDDDEDLSDIDNTQVHSDEDDDLSDNDF